jgi:hypothetical protein
MTYIDRGERVSNVQRIVFAAGNVQESKPLSQQIVLWFWGVINFIVLL